MKNKWSSIIAPIIISPIMIAIPLITSCSNSVDFRDRLNAYNSSKRYNKISVMESDFINLENFSRYYYSRAKKPTYINSDYLSDLYYFVGEIPSNYSKFYKQKSEIIRQKLGMNTNYQENANNQVIELLSYKSIEFYNIYYYKYYSYEHPITHYRYGETLMSSEMNTSILGDTERVSASISISDLIDKQLITIKIKTKIDSSKCYWYWSENSFYDKSYKSPTILISLYNKVS